MKEDSVNNGKEGVKKVSGTSRGDSQRKPPEVPEELRGIMNTFLERLYISESDRRLDLAEVYSFKPDQTSSVGARRKTPNWLIDKIVGNLPRNIGELEKRKIREELMKEVLQIIMNSTMNDIKEKIVNWVSDVGRRFNISEEKIKDIQREVLKMDSKTLKRSFLAVRDSKEMLIETLEDSTEPRDIGRKAEELVLLWLALQLWRSGRDYILIPYFKTHKGKRKRKSNRGKKQRGAKHVDIALIDFTKRIIALIEIKNWPSENKKTVYYYELKKDKGSYRKDDEPKWKQSEEDILEFLRALKEYSDDSSILALKLFKGILEKHNTVDIDKVLPIYREVLEWDPDIINGPELDTLEVDKELLTRESMKRQKAEVLRLVEYLLISQSLFERYSKEGMLSNIVPEDFKFMKFFVMFTGVLENGNIEGGRGLDRKILEKFKIDGIVHIEVSPALKSIVDGRYWKIAETTARLILKVIDNEIKVGTEIGNVLINFVDEEDEAIVFEFVYLEKPECRGSIRIPKHIWRGKSHGGFGRNVVEAS